METRQTPRLAISLTTKLKIDPSVSQHFNIAKNDIEVRVVDISVNGIGLLSQYFIPKGVIIDLEFNIAKEIIALKAEVRSAVLGGKGLTRLGLKFMDINQEQKQLIADFIKENERRAKPRRTIQKDMMA